MVSEGGRSTFLGGKCPFGRLPMTQPTSAHMGNSNWIQWLIFLKGGHEAGRIINGLGWVQEELQERSEGEYDQNTMYTCPKLSINKS